MSQIKPFDWYLARTVLAGTLLAFAALFFDRLDRRPDQRPGIA